MSRVNKKISALAVVEIVLIAVLAVVMIVMLAFNFLFKDSNSVISLLGYSFYNTKAVSMQPKIPQNTLIIAKKSEIPNIDENSVILCNVGEHTTIIRVKEIQHDGDEIFYVVKFDIAEENETFRISSDAVIAKAMQQFDGFGLFIDFATSPVGIIIAVVIPLIFIIAIQVTRILGMRRLEEEASSIDDIDELINFRDEESPAPVTFTEPKFVEDVTGKIPLVSRLGVSEPEQPKPEKILAVDGRGRAEYAERLIKQEEHDNSPLFTYDKISRSKEQESKEPVLVGAKKELSHDELYINKPTRIEPQKSATEEFFEKYAADTEEFFDKYKQVDMFTSEKSEPVIFTPHLSNIIPESIAAVQEEADSPKKSGFDESVRAYFEKEEKVFVPEQSDSVSAEEPPAIPENAVLPKETIAPPKKKKSNKAVAELMSIIDAEETKLKK